MPEPDNGPEQELGPAISEAFQTKADGVRGPRGRGLAAEARRRVHKRRQMLVAGAATVVVAVAIGGVWNVVGGSSPIATNSSDRSGEAAAPGSKQVPDAAGCPEQHAILTAGGHEAVPSGTGLDLQMPVSGLQACRYRLVDGAAMLLGSAGFNATAAQQVVDAIKVLPERNPDLPVFKCTPQLAQPSEAIVLRFDTSFGKREIWVGYDGCSSPGFFTGAKTYGLFAPPLKLFMQGPARPASATYLDHLEGW